VLLPVKEIICHRRGFSLVDGLSFGGQVDDLDLVKMGVGSK